MSIANQAKTLRATRSPGAIRQFPPRGTVRCEGPAMFRSQVSRDTACILDVNPSVTAWRCMSLSIRCGTEGHVPDFHVFNEDGRSMLIDAPDRRLPVSIDNLSKAASEVGSSYRVLAREEVYDGFRLKNAKDLLRYADCTVTLADRLRLLTALDEFGSMPLVECLKAFSETSPVPGISALILSRYVEIDLDEAPIGPETTVRRIAR